MAIEISHNRRTERELIAGIAHDLAHPLTAMRGTLEGVRDGIVDPADPTSTSRLLDAVETMQATVHDLRDVAAYRAGRLRLELRPIDVNSVINRVVALYRDIATRRGLRLDAVNAEHITLDTDERRIERIIANLVLNAFQETAPGGGIRIGLTTDRTKPCLAILSVEDDGGPAAFERLTAAFHVSAGGGLGLRVVAAIAEALNATVHIERTETGSRVEVLLSSITSPHRAATMGSR